MSRLDLARAWVVYVGYALAVPWIIVSEAWAQSAAAPTDPPRPPQMELRITPETLKAMEQKIETYRRENKIPSIAVAIVHKGKIVFEKGFGWARLEEKAPATPHTQYALASVSKTLTAAGLMRLVEQGLVDLDRPVNDYLGETHLRSAVGDPAEITVRHVATHTAGLMTYWHMVNERDPLGIPSRADRIAQYGMAMIPPGERHVYSSVGYAVIPRIIELQAGMPFEEYMQREIFEPLGMTRTTRGAAVADDAALKYSGTEGRGMLVPDEPGLPLANYTPIELASGGYYSTAHDLARYAIFNLKDSLEGGHAPLSHATLDEMHRPTVYQAKYYGQAIAWETIADESGVLAIEHGGGGPGMRARFELFPQDDFAIALLVNDTRVLKLIGIKRLILDELKPGFFDYRASLFGFPLESKGANEATGTSSQPLTEEERKARWLAAARVLSGEWDGQIGGPSANHPITLVIKETGEVFVDFDKEELPGVLTRTEISPSLSPSSMGGISLGLVNPEFPWRNSPHYVRLHLEITDGQIRGRVEFTSYAVIGETSPFSNYSISHWTEFQRRDADSPDE